MNKRLVICEEDVYNCCFMYDEEGRAHDNEFLVIGRDGSFEANSATNMFVVSPSTFTGVAVNIGQVKEGDLVLSVNPLTRNYTVSKVKSKDTLLTKEVHVIKKDGYVLLSSTKDGNMIFMDEANDKIVDGFNMDTLLTEGFSLVGVDKDSNLTGLGGLRHENISLDHETEIYRILLEDNNNAILQTRCRDFATYTFVSNGAGGISGVCVMRPTDTYVSSVEDAIDYVGMSQYDPIVIGDEAFIRNFEPFIAEGVMKSELVTDMVKIHELI